MRAITLRSLNDFAEWRQVARSLLLAGTPPEAVRFLEPGGDGGLFADEPPPAVADRAVGTVPPRFLELGEAAICHSDAERFDLLYRLLWRLLRDRSLLSVRSDPDVGRLDRRVSAVRRDSHKMKAFVRFRSVGAVAGAERFVAWFEPEHYVLERVAPFFSRRFTGMQWSIVTPHRSASWDGAQLSFGPGGRKADVPGEDALEEVWRTYYASIFNPARLNVPMMKSEMPVKYWRNLPEAPLIPQLVRDARAAEAEMIARQTSIPPSRHLRQAERRVAEAEPVPAEIRSLAEARAAVVGCRRCPLHEFATQAVFGEGPAGADLVIVGEQPGDQEDLAGKPFVGPAGQVLDRVLEEVGIDRTRVYVTNAVKHFKFTPRGKRRIHQSPNAGEIAACRFWLDLELQFVRPRLVVAMGGSAAASLLGRTVTVSSVRGRPTALPDGTALLVTVHPSYLLRMPDRERAALERERFADDFRQVRQIMERLAA